MNKDECTPSGEELIEAFAYRALITEAEATPKPGLVDRADSGAHTDMDVRTFRTSAAVLRPYFLAFAERGSHECDEPIEGLFRGIRSLGRDAESAMRTVTGGVNTHKGAIFTLGILTYISGRMLGNGELTMPERVCAGAAKLVSGIEDELKNASTETHGVSVFRRYGATGVRGEAAKGFPSVLNYALPQIRRRDLPENERVLLALLNLMANVADTNVLMRAGEEGVSYMQSAARDCLTLYSGGGAGLLDALTAMNRDFIERNISPGGCADLVAAALFLDSMQPAVLP